jgi:2-amino-4-hydroxy-6-hydroxymethyldihydropteridine diphosphokinase
MEQKLKLHQVVIALGTNLGDKELNLKNAIYQINSKVGDVSKVSSIFKNSAVGFESENEFFNACLICITHLDPFQTLSELQAIEKKLGRIKTKETFEDREIDLDIIFFDQLIIETENLQIPHRLYHERNFVLIPLLELFDFKDPKTLLNISQLIR